MIIMNYLRYSLLTKIILQLCLFASTLFIIFSSIRVVTYLMTYSQTSSFYETYKFEERYSKYMERMAVYIRYCERGYIPDTSYIINNNLPADTYYFLNKRDEEQNTFEFYDRKLNRENSNFLYYVKNITTEKEYFSPQLLEISNYKPVPNATQNEILSTYCELIKDAPTYFVLNTKTGVYSTNLTNWGHLSSYDVNWIVQCLTGKSMTNYIQTIETDISLDNSAASSSNDSFIQKEKLEGTTSNSEYIVYTSILPDIPFQKDDFAPLYQEYQDSKKSYQQSSSILVLSIILFLFVFLLTIACCGHKAKPDGILLHPIDKLFTELTLLLPLIGIVVLYILIGKFNLVYPLKQLVSWSNFKTPTNIYFAVYLILYPWLMFWFYSCIRKLKAHCFIKSSFIYWSFAGIKKNIVRFFKNGPITYHVAAYFLVFIVLNFLSMFCFLFTNNGFGFLVGLLFTMISILFAAYFLFRYASDFNIIVKETKQIADGNLTHKLPEAELTGANQILAGYINHIGDGLSVAVEEQLKSERLKTELITNVSHDIKTPLTSIINYVDLLKKEDLKNEKAMEYISILQAKSWRLKNLIEDLVEASKASSGAINLNLERLNLVELVRQSAGEFEDRFLGRQLEIVMNVPEHSVYILADGRCTFRMIENIFSNAYKYALAGTRIYVDIVVEPFSEQTAAYTDYSTAQESYMTQTNHTNLYTDSSYVQTDSVYKQYVTLSVKNISANKLNISSSELMERFVRGDLSRNTEGSGLGLSIVKSLAELQKIGFDMFLDGDLFKTVFTFEVIEIK